MSNKHMKASRRQNLQRIFFQRFKKELESMQKKHSKKKVKNPKMSTKLDGDMSNKHMKASGLLPEMIDIPK